MLYHSSYQLLMPSYSHNFVRWRQQSLKRFCLVLAHPEISDAAVVPSSVKMFNFWKINVLTSKFMAKSHLKVF